jgi:hypothetical protein
MTVRPGDIISPLGPELDDIEGEYEILVVS